MIIIPADILNWIELFSKNFPINVAVAPKNINTIEKTYDYLTKNCNSNPIILAPNEIWNLQIKDNKKSLLFWKNIYDNLNDLDYYEEKDLYKLND